MIWVILYYTVNWLPEFQLSFTENLMDFDVILGPN